MSTAKVLTIRTPPTPETLITPLDSPSQTLYHIPSTLTAAIPTITLTHLAPPTSPPPYTTSPTLPTTQPDGTDTKITYVPFLGATLVAPDTAHERETFKISQHGDGEVAGLYMSGHGEMTGQDGELVAKRVGFTEKDGGKTEGLEIRDGKVEEELVVAVWVAWLWVLERRGELKSAEGELGKVGKLLDKLNPVPWLEGRGRGR